MSQYITHLVDLLPKILLFYIHLYSAVNCLEVPLSDGWSLRNNNQSIHIAGETLPSGVYSALENAKIVDSIVNSFNDVNLRWIARDVWTYSLKFDVQQEYFSHSNMVLVFHGLDTIATITLNGHDLLPKPNNMFIRYRYNVRDSLITTDNFLEIKFESPIEAATRLAKDNKRTPPACPPATYNGECNMNFLRKMQASFAWDWGLAAPSVGIWKHVCLEIYDTAIIRDVIYSLNALDDDWKISVSVYLESGVGPICPYEGYLTLIWTDLPEFSPIVKQINVLESQKDIHIETIQFTIPKKSVNLWWPNGFGEQTLYQLNVTWTGENRNIFTNEIIRNLPQYSISSHPIRIGFRTIELIEDSMKRGNSFYFKINGEAMFMKGTNWIPTDILPEKLFNKPKIDYLMGSAKDAHMNVIRVWGGGVYESDYFYDLADENGILIWQDMMFACAMYPVYEEFLDSIEIEIAQNVRRIQRHPSILVWAGNNENEAALVQNWYGTRDELPRFIKEYIQLYNYTIEKAVKENDQWHIWLYSSPSNGNKLAKIVNENPGDNNYGDVHYYNYISDAWNSNIFPRARFVSEYGFQSIPSIHSIKNTMYANDDIQEIIDHRQHFPFGSAPITLLIMKHLPLPDETSPDYVKAFVYFSQISQAMSTKVETETYRVGRYHEWNTMGALYWQLNDVWIAPSWSSIEYNGNFKILHYWIRDVFAPVHVIANINSFNKLNVYIVRDTLGDVNQLQLHMKIFRWSKLQSVYQTHWMVSMPSNSVKLVHQKNIADYFTDSISKKNCFFYFELMDAKTQGKLSTNFLLLESFKNSRDVVNPRLQYEVKINKCDAQTHIHSAKIQIKVSAPAIFVYIQLKNQNIEHYKLSKNGFIQLTKLDWVQISFFNKNCAMTFDNDDIDISTVNDFIAK